jgi:hypothetical protein
MYIITRRIRPRDAPSRGAALRHGSARVKA